MIATLWHVVLPWLLVVRVLIPTINPGVSHTIDSLAPHHIKGTDSECTYMIILRRILLFLTVTIDSLG